MKRIAIVITVIAFASCGQLDHKNPKRNNIVHSGWSTCSHNDNYSVQYPPLWQVKPNFMGTDFVIYAAMDSTNPKFAENVNVITVDLKDTGYKLDKYTEAAIQHLTNTVTNLNMIYNNPLKDSVGNYQKLVFSGDQGLFHLMFEQQYRIIGKTAYILTLTAQKEKWNTEQQIGEQILSTFTIK
jgi:hypothetical protein